MRIEERSREYLKTIVIEYCIIIDITVVLSDGFGLFCRNVEELGEKGRTNIFISQSEWNELKTMIQHKVGRTRDAAQKAISLLERLAQLQLAHCAGIGAEFTGLCEKLPHNIKLCLITQKKELANKTASNPDLEQFDEYQIRRINQYGYISIYRDGDASIRYQYRKERKLVTPLRITKISNRLLQVYHEPVKGSKVYLESRQSLVLLEQVENVMDGIIYDVGGGIYAKVYHKNCIDIYHREKCKQMLTKGIHRKSAVCWPLGLIYDGNSEFVGYVFKAYKGEPLSLSVFKKSGLNLYFPGWKKIDIVQLAITILEGIEELHRNNILIGCLDLGTIKVVDSKTVFFVETDKYQVDGFPCLLRNNLFIPPERIDYKDKNFLFSEATENYVIAVLTFMILMPGKAPYSQRWGGNYIRNIKNMQFPYAFQENHSKGVPSGFWRFVWSHLYYDLKKAFYQTFQSGEVRNAPKQRYGLSFWSGKLKEYHRKLETGEYCRKDKYSALMFPDTFRKSDKVKYKLCSHCEKEFPEWFMDNEFDSLCKSCRDKKSESDFRCQSCGRIFYYSIKEELLHTVNDWVPQKRCRECKRYRLKIQ